MGRSTLSWIVTAAVAGAGFAGVVAWPVAGRTRGIDAVPAQRAACAPPPSERLGVDDLDPRRVVRSTPVSPAEAGTALAAALHAEDPARGRRTWAAIERGIEGVLTSQVADRGSPAAVCGPAGELDDVLLTVDWQVSTGPDGVFVHGGRAVVDAFPAEVQRCLDTFLAGSTGHFPTRAPLAGVDVDYRFVIPARFGGGADAAERNGARRPSSDAGPAGR